MLGEKVCGSNEDVIAKLEHILNGCGNRSLRKPMQITEKCWSDSIILEESYVNE